MSHGKPITRTQAQLFINQHLKIVKKNRRKVSDFCKGANDTEAATYYYADVSGKPGNCFIFDKEVVENFFQKGATQLLVFCGADSGLDGVVHPTEDDPTAGKPTVVLVGCTMTYEDGQEVYTTLPSMEPHPAVEHPPTFYFPTHPDQRPLADTTRTIGTNESKRSKLHSLTIESPAAAASLVFRTF
jgi:hypothetical protein